MTENKEFDLSEKEKYFAEEIAKYNGAKERFYWADDVKEFIKILLADGWEAQLVNDNEDFKKGVQAMKEKIVRYAGEKLK